MGKTGDLFKKIRDKGTFHAKMGTIKNRNRMNPSEVEDIKNRWQEYTEWLYKKKDLNDPDNHDGVINSPRARHLKSVKSSGSWFITTCGSWDFSDSCPDSFPLSLPPCFLCSLLLAVITEGLWDARDWARFLVSFRGLYFNRLLNWNFSTKFWISVHYWFLKPNILKC